MYTRPGPEAETVLAARAGDRGALERLVSGHLPLVYNIAGRAMDGHPDVDDVVQETMARLVSRLGELRDPDSFRSWLVAVTMNQVRDWHRSRTGSMATLDEALGLADPGADFVSVTVTRLGLSGQRRETAEATRWLDADDREVLAVWWLEVAGEVGRSELAAGLGVSEQHAAVRVQRTRRRLEASRAVVRALTSECPALNALRAGWNGRPGALWRKRFSRHVRDCPACTASAADLVPAERLLAGLALVVIPTTLALSALKAAGTAATLTGHAALGAGQGVVGLGSGVAGAGGGAVGASSGVVGASPGVVGAGKAAVGVALGGKPIAAIAIGASVVVGGAAAVYTMRPDEPAERRAVPAMVASSPGTAANTPGPSASPTPSPSPSRTPTPTPTAKRSLYGRVVDTVDDAPPRNARPKALPKRREGTLTITGKHGFSRYGGAPQMTHRGDYITITGKGYLQVRWGILYRNRAGDFPPATWTGLKGKLFHVASGGGRRLDDESAPGETWMGPVRLPRGHQQMWQNEFFYLDGSVTLHNNEGGTDVDLSVQPRTWSEVWADLTTRPDPAKAIVRYGLTRDTGDDRAPVPQYVTRSADPADVRQKSVIS